MSTSIPPARRVPPIWRAGVLGLAAIIAGVVVVGRNLTHSLAPDPARVAGATATTSEAPTPTPTTPLSTFAAPPFVLDQGLGTFTYATGEGPVFGTSGTLQRYRVAVEDGTDIAADAFAAAVDSVLGDARSWIGGNNVRLQRVAGTASATFTIYLATPVTSEHMCAEGGLDTQAFTNCRLGTNKVVINLARWLTAVPDYGADLDVYRAYAINHEVGHQLGYNHELCPGPGEPAPVMQQQTYGLQGCVANAWPYLAGTRYRGPPADQ
jgi:hypothetical protein